MEGASQQQNNRHRRGLRQAMVAVVASLLGIGVIVAVSDSDSDGQTSALSAPSTPSSDTIDTSVTTPESSAVATQAPPIAEGASPTISSDTIAPTIPTGTFTPADVPSINAKAYAVYDVTSKQWLADSGADLPLPVGSVMKLLTSYVVLQNGDLAKEVTVGDLDVDISESAIGLFQGEQLPRDVLLRAMLIVSANDAAQALAIDVGGSTGAFVDKMNAAAQQLGLDNTVAANPIGLDAAGAHSSARDMIELADLLMQDSTFQQAVAKKTASLHGQTFDSTNKLLSTYDGATGVKTGHTTQAGYCLVGSATRDGRSIIVAVLGAPSDAERLAGATALLDWAFAH